MAEPDLQAKVLSWLGAQGYPLEMSVARAFRSSGLSVSQAWPYVDVETGQQRETDLLVTRRFGEEADRVRVSLVIECKTSRGKPWVLFTDDKQRMHPRARVAQRFVAPMEATSASWYRPYARVPGLAAAPLIAGSGTPAYALTKVTFADKQSNEDAAFGALMSVGKAAAGVQTWLSRAYKAPEREERALILPVLVLDAPLFICRLGEDENLNLEEVTRGSLDWHFRVGKQGTPTTIVEVVTKEAVEQLPADLEATAEAFWAAKIEVVDSVAVVRTDGHP